MRGAAEVQIIFLEKESDNIEKKLGATVTYPEREPMTRSIREWREKLDVDRSTGDNRYPGLIDQIDEKLYNYVNGLKEKESPKDVTNKLMDIALDGGKTILFSDDRGDAYAHVKIDGHFENLRIDSSCDRWLSSAFYSREKRVPGMDALRSARCALEGMAIHDGEKHELHLRTARFDGAFWYDLGDESRRAVKITSEGWKIENEPPILFKHLPHMKPQDEPVSCTNVGAIDRLLDLMNLRGNDRSMFRIMLVTDLVPGIAHCGLSLTGQQGSGKSSMLKMEKQLIDPSEIEVFTSIKDEQELIRGLDRNHIFLLDNISKISRSQSDLLCMAITGAAHAMRRKYTDDEDFIRKYKRIIRLNGISNEIKASDLLSRVIIIDLPPITKDARRSEGELWPEFYRLRPLVLGELFDCLAKAIAHYERMSFSPPPRMADWYNWAEAVALAQGMKQDSFQRLFSEYEDRQHAEAVDQSILAPLLEEIANDRFIGTASDLLKVLNLMACDKSVDTRNRDWPRSHISLGKMLKPLTADILARGVSLQKDITFERLRKERPDLSKVLARLFYNPQDRMIVLERVKNAETVDYSSGTSPAQTPVSYSQLPDNVTPEQENS